jgi:hypothetical protein
MGWLLVLTILVIHTYACVCVCVCMYVCVRVCII